MISLEACPVCGDLDALHTALREQHCPHPTAPLTVTLVRCDCGHIYASPQPTAAELQPHYTAGYHVFAAVAQDPDTLIREQLRTVDGVQRLQHVRVVPGSTYLDVGCGLADQVAAMERLGVNAIGVDPSPAAVAAAWKLGRSGVMACSDTADLSMFGDGRFDAVSLFHSLEHTPDPCAVLRECARLLAPGGEVMVAVPNAESAGAAMFGDAWQHWDLPVHLNHFTRNTLIACAERAGLHCTSMQTESLPQSIEVDLCRAGKRWGVPLRVSDGMRLAWPVARHLARTWDSRGRGDALVALFAGI